MTEQTSRTKEDQLVAAISHGGALIPTFGLLIPLIIWITQKDRSTYLKHQALQAAAWQAMAFVMQILLFGCYFFSFFLIIPFSVIAEGETFSSNAAAGGAIAGGFGLLIFCVFGLFMLGGLVYIGFAIAGVVNSLRGQDFQYPVIGRWVNSRLNTDVENSAGSEENNLS